MGKESIRKQIEAIRNDFNVHIQKGSISPEAQLTIKSLFQLLEIIVTVLLEKKIRKNSSNSGLPPSQGFDSNGNRNKKVDNKAAHRTGGRLDNSKDLETSETVTPKKCSECNGELKKAKVTSTEERQEIDITYEIHTHTVVSETKECPQCGFENKGQFPEGIDGPIQYGIGINGWDHRFYDGPNVIPSTNR